MIATLPYALSPTTPALVWLQERITTVVRAVLFAVATDAPDVQDDALLLDQSDVEQARSGDENAYARLIQRYENRIMTQMWRFARNRTIAEELVQDVFVEAYASLRTYRGDAPFLHWLGRIASRVGYRYLKKRAKARKHVPLEEWDQATDARMQERESRAAAWVHDLLSRLDPEEQLILTLHYFEDRSMQEIAEQMNWNRDTVKMRAYRARQKIKEMIEREALTEELSWIL